MRNEPSDSVVVTVTASSVVSDRNCIVLGAIVAGAATTCAITLYDPPKGTTTSTGATTKLVLNAPAADSQVYHSDGGIQFMNGCVAVVSGTGAVATVIYAKI